ncbi:MAG TPA: DUF1552 domain-containing protein [Vicinamibacterales bacterium]
MSMFITQKHLSRRTVLRGMGATMALPLLDAMVPAQTLLRKTVAAPRTRLACIEMVHGSAGSTQEGLEKHYWVPEKEGADFDFTMILKPLEPYRDYLTVVTQTDLRAAEAWSAAEEGADHFRSSAVFLTAAHPKQTEGSDVRAGTSIDQLYAQRFGDDTPLPSLQLAIENVDAAGTCGFNYACVYSGPISWSSPTTPMPMTIDPRMAFENLFGEGGTAAERAARQRANRSILDGITREISRFRQQLGTSDRNRLNSYLESVREIERRIEKIEQRNASGDERALPTAPIGVPDSWEEHVKLMFDLQVLAFSSEVTRVSSFKLSRDTSNRVFPESGIKAPFHAMSHHGSIASKIYEYAKLNVYHMSLLPYFLQKLRDTPDGDGNLLDHSLVLWGSPMGDSNVHTHRRLPVLLAGHANGQVKGNLHVRCKDETPYANVLLTMLHKLGIEQDAIGDSTGEVAI